MFSKINKASIAVISGNPDVHLFFSFVFEEELDMQMYLDSQIYGVLYDQECFDFLIIDAQTALKENRRGCWKKICDLFKNNVLVLISVGEEKYFNDQLFQAVKTIFYPFTKKDFYTALGERMASSAALCSAPVSLSGPTPDFDDIPQLARLIGSSEKINEVRRKILMVADTNMPMIFLGESGTGKTMAAKIAHDLSLRKDKPFVIANMASVKSELIESALFGNVRGAYTDARDRSGLFKSADGGTLFMDEIAELSLECQAKLLRVIETGIFRPIGSDQEVKSDVRLIFATNADLQSLVRKRRFREDLYWRIVDFPITVPALRERMEDFPLLIESELKEIQKVVGKSFLITKEAIQKMSSCDWPGNFRQFKSCLRRAAILSRDTCTIDHEAISF